MADTRKYTGYEEEFELSNIQKIKNNNIKGKLANKLIYNVWSK